MLPAALSALMLAAAAPAVAPPAPFEALLSALRPRCPTMEPRVRAAGPDALLRLEHGFRDRLSPANRSRLDQAKRGVGGGADAGLTALIRTDQIGAFADYVCARETAATAPR